MENAIILHGIGGSPMLNWYQYAASKAREKAFTPHVPQLPLSDKPNLDLTYQFLVKKYAFDKETVLIGHSSGASLALGILQKLPDDTVIKRTILVSGFIDPNLTPELHTYIARSDYDKLFPKAWDWEKIRIVQMHHAKTMEEKLHGKLVLVPDALHFSVNSGGERFREFSELVEYL